MPLTPLPFGRQIVRLSGTLAEAGETMAATVPGLQLFDAGLSKTFRAMTATCEFGGLRIMANARQTCHMEIAEGAGWHLVVPTAGRVTVSCGGRKHDLLPASTALILPDLERSVRQETCVSVVVTAFNPVTLNTTLSAMEGIPQDGLPPDRPYTVPLSARAGMFDAFLALCRVIDTTIAEPGLAGKLGLADTIYRWMAAGLLVPGRPESPIRKDTSSKIDLVCDLIRHSADRPLTLTEMELASGLSARALQYAFKSRFNCSPLEWQRRERMLQARESLLALRSGQTITQLAQAMGFSSSAAFATRYRHHFGETPTETLGRPGRLKAGKTPARARAPSRTRLSW